jgi:ferredoxin
MKERFDERNTIFSRMLEIEPSTEKYVDYYLRNPEWEDVDAALRDAPDGVFSSRAPEQRQIDAVFSLLKDLRPLAGHSAAERAGSPPVEISAFSDKEASAKIRKLAESYGASLCGIAETDPAWVYSVRGRGQHYGKEVCDPLPMTIVFAVEMDESEINRAPAIEQSMEVVREYLNVAVTGLALSYIIRGWGYNAVCHMDGESELVLPPAAEAAGLGSVGLAGVLVTKEFGSRIRLGAVTTDMPLSLSGPSPFQVAKVCRTCGKCAELCPSGCIPAFGTYKPGQHFSIDSESCFRTWREFGTDCGVCLAACPFSHPKGNNTDEKPQTGFLKGLMFGGN